MNPQGLSGRNTRANKTFARPGDLSLLARKRHSLTTTETIRSIQSEKEKMLKVIEQPIALEFETDVQDIEEQRVEEEQHMEEEQQSVEVHEQPDPTTPSEKKRNGRGKTTWLSIQKKSKKNDNAKLEVIIPTDRTIAVGPGAKDFVTELSVKVHNNARHDVKNWKGVPDLAKNRIVAHMLDTFELVDNVHNWKTIMEEANKLYRYRRNRLHTHFKKLARKEESLINKPKDVNEAEWKFLVENFSSDEFKAMSERNISNKAKQKVNHICGRKSFQAVSYEASSSQGSKKDISNQLVEAQNQVLKKMEEDMKARNILHAAEGTKMRLLSEKATLEQKIIVLEKKKLSEVENA